ncbi:hypothetical protein X943_001287 [Babesia divergens]|uniref:Uncharacterized protein n=1 Tax=Babesia divergens TaxID=32595 RepID=A0AAD9GCV9_BABDI|nr:hypothetical protein X943_001287 [Babesia divergens]
MDALRTLDILERKPPATAVPNTDAIEEAYTRIFTNASLEEAVKRLYSPSKGCSTVESPNRRAKKPHKEKPCDFSGVFRFDQKEVARLCKSTDLQLTPSDGELLFLGESLQLLRTSISEILGLPLKDGLEKSLSDTKDPEAYFDCLVSRFLEHLDNESVVDVRLPDETDSTGPIDCNAAPGLPNEHDVIRAQLRCITLWCNWAQQLSAHTETALRLVRTPVRDIDLDMLIETAMGIKESNRNMVFYSSVCTQLAEALKTKDGALDMILSTLMCKIHYIRHMQGSTQSADSDSWKRLSAQLSAIVVNQNEIPYDDSATEHMANMNSVRNEMRLRMDRKGYCDALSRECDMYTHEYNTLNTRYQAIASRVDQIMKQLHDLGGSFRWDSQVDALKIVDARKLCPLLQHFLVRLNLRMLQYPNREVLYKVVREREYVLQVSLLAPRDMLMPSVDAVMPTFPLVFVFYVDESDTISVREPSLSISTLACFSMGKESPRASIHDSSPRTWPLTYDPDWGLDDFMLTTSEMPPIFCDRLRSWYDAAHLHVWNCYYIDCYRRGKLETLHLFPQQLRKKHLSQYTIADNNWILSNQCASITFTLEFNEKLEPRCKFSNFEQKDVLTVENSIDLIDRLSKDVKTINKNNVAKVSAIYNIIHMF